MTAVNGSGTIATGGFTTDPTFEKMVDLMVSVSRINIVSVARPHG